MPRNSVITHDPITPLCSIGDATSLTEAVEPVDPISCIDDISLSPSAVIDFLRDERVRATQRHGNAEMAKPKMEYKMYPLNRWAVKLLVAVRDTRNMDDVGIRLIAPSDFGTSTINLDVKEAVILQKALNDLFGGTNGR